jgi:hypothetical protein
VARQQGVNGLQLVVGDRGIRLAQEEAECLQAPLAVVLDAVELQDILVRQPLVFDDDEPGFQRGERLLERIVRKGSRVHNGLDPLTRAKVREIGDLVLNANTLVKLVITEPGSERARTLAS